MIERDLSQLDQNINIESDDSILLSAHCYGCLPSLDVYHDFSFDEFVIAWYGYNEDYVYHPVTISYKIDNSIYGSHLIRSFNGTIQEKIYSEEYFVSWSIKCSKYDCSSCMESGTFLKKASGETEINPSNDCYKEYLHYRIEKVSNGMYYLILDDDDDDIYNSDKYLNINDIRFYEIDAYGGNEKFLMLVI